MQQGAAAVVTHGWMIPVAALIGATDWTKSPLSEVGGYVVSIGLASIT